MRICWKVSKARLLVRIWWGFAEVHPTGDSWNDAMRRCPEEFIWKIELQLMMIVGNLTRKSSKTFVGLANKAAGGPCDHWCLVTNCWTLVSVHCLHIYTIPESSVKVSGCLATSTYKYLEVPTSIWRWPLWGCLATLGLWPLGSGTLSRCTGILIV